MKKINKKPDLDRLAVFVIERDRKSLKTIVKELKDKGAQVYTAQAPGKAGDILMREHIDVIVASVDLINEQVINGIKEYKAGHPESLFYVLADRSYSFVETSLESVRLLVNDYISKPLDIERFYSMIETSMGRSFINESTSIATVDPLVSKIKPYFLFRSPVMRRTVAQIPRIAASEQTVLITGETGTGKEIVARAVHMLSRYSSGPFVPINCGAIPESLIEGELFGHEKGAFTGAIKTRKGKFESAEQGTLFLDEIGDMDLRLQVRLLRILEDKKVFRVGGETSVPVNMRVIAASNIDLLKAVKDGLFREDLYYRLNILCLHLPPLRERVEDIALLAVHFLERVLTEMNWQPPYPNLSSETIHLLEQIPWKGNVRELRNLMTRVATLLPRNTKQIFPFHILSHLHEREPEYACTPTEEYKEDRPAIKAGMTLHDAEELLIQETLKKTNGNKTKAASLLGINLRTLRRKLNKPAGK
ncbi:transcriptional regulatory protein ZraR [bacterium BMS3Abin10]|nr:transcriptional regulatory protein ZraR [bacterium BMS3Abin10]HDH51132.1 sigma-54-dependent Fis family transcriptional regulator [Nitrospirota bacterium]HDZ62394.1 sigma-54-dependent Fis family transcriptional regulator [Nitrospirota bacterium]